MIYSQKTNKHMTTLEQELKTKFDNAVLKIINTGLDIGNNTSFLTTVYTEMFDEYPSLIAIDEDGWYLNRDADEFEDEDDNIEEDVEYKDEEKESVFTYDKIFVQATICNIVDAYKGKSYVVRNNRYPIIIANNLIVFWNDYYRQIVVLQSKEQLTEDFKSLIANKVDDKDHRWFSYVTSTNTGFSETALRCKKQDIDINMNYNDDLPHEKITEFLKSNKSGLVLLCGEPGTGKSTYIRHLMYELRGRHFMVMDSSVFNYITDASFIDLLLNNQNAVIILEDCETLLADRMTTGNAMLSTLLNLSDGIIGDGLNFKFICTFNAPIGKLDKAIQRKGRMKVKYEFKRLSPEKTSELGTKLGFDIPDGESLPLSDIFNYGEDNGANDKCKKIGFSKDTK